MRRIITEIAVSLDGFIEGRKGELDWMVMREDAPYSLKFLSRFDTIFYGRVAYEKFGIYDDDPCDPRAELTLSGRLSRMRKYVFTRSVKHVPGNGMVVGHNLTEEVKRIKDEDGKDIWLCGGSAMISTFAELDLVDEYLLAVQPVILGSGRPLFSITNPLNLELLGTESLKSGVVILNYRPGKRKNKSYG